MTVLLSLLLVYLLPSLVAGYRVHPNGPAILALNVLLGWTGFGWAAALIWSLTALPTAQR